MNTCAICGKRIILAGICSKCWKEHGDAPWVKEIISMHRKFEYLEDKEEAIEIDEETGKPYRW